jgi:hypothetical protein
MYRPNGQRQLNALAKKRVVREAKQPYAAEVEDRETEKSQHEKPAETDDGGRRRRKPGS